MYQAFIDHPLFQAVVVLMLTLLGKRIWEKWLSKSSRVTPEICSLNQKACRDAIIAQMTFNNAILDKSIQAQRERLVYGDREFERRKSYEEATSHTLKLILMTLSELCEMDPGCKMDTKDDLREELKK